MIGFGVDSYVIILILLGLGLPTWPSHSPISNTNTSFGVLSQNSQFSPSSFSFSLRSHHQIPVMEEQFILRVPPNVAERIERLLNESNDPSSSSEDKSLDLSFCEDGRSGTFVIGNDHFPASLLDLPCVVESFKTYDDNSLIKTADVGQMIMVRESGDAAPDVIEYRHGLTPPMRDARKRRFRREPDLNPELVSRVEKDLFKIMAGRTADNLDVEAAEQDEGDENARGAGKKPAPTPAPKHDVPETLTNAGEPDRSDSDESDDSV